ncbi:hypothetical protein HMPREF9440_01306 [Sutterella parvirubra YIT 11816]|uniref:Uncharacterized protein n=1 Tax=Sutterella parvirubra YIT 11816 TaxID=762967 RepID=H3KEZ1_9BURK|nr:hypothetical protein HMPREF9440_01306 [Sutterella parvirubra YIT 11816]
MLRWKSNGRREIFARRHVGASLRSEDGEPSLRLIDLQSTLNAFSP